MIKNIYWLLAIIIVLGLYFYYQKENEMDQEDDTEMMAKAYFEEGKELLDEKNYQGAVELLEKSLEIREDEEVREVYNIALGYIGPM